MAFRIDSARLTQLKPMNNDSISSPESDSGVRRPYETPTLTVHGTVAALTQDPQSRPRAGTVMSEAEVIFLGRDA